VLLHGPRFLLDILTTRKNDGGRFGKGEATRVLFEGWCGMDRKQTRVPTRTLTSWAKEAFARRDGCAKAGVTVRMWEICQGRGLWGVSGLGQEGVVGLVNAGVVEGGD